VSPRNVDALLDSNGTRNQRNVSNQELNALLELNGTRNHANVLLQRNALLDKSGTRRPRSVALGRGHFCRSSGDPHFGTFAGKTFDLYKVGDFQLVNSKSFRVDARHKKWNKAAVNERFAVLMNRKTDRVEVVTEEKVYVNGKAVRLNVGQTYTVAAGGNIHRYQANRIKVTAKNGAYVDAVFNHGKGWPLPQYADLIVFVPHLRGVSGLCVSSAQQKRAVGVFAHEYNPRFPETKKVKSTPLEKARALARCKKARVYKRHLAMCVTDMIQSGFSIHARGLRKFENRMKRDVRKFAKKHRKHHGRRHHGRKHHGRRHHGRRENVRNHARRVAVARQERRENAPKRQ